MCCMRSLILAALVALTPLTALAAPPSVPAPGQVTDLGEGFSLGFDVAPLRPQLGPPPTMAPRDFELLDSTALSFDLKLKWPGSDTTRALEPYLSLGPALFVLEPDYVSRMLGTRVDPDFRLGAKAGAGLNWHLGKDVTLFGAYEATRGSSVPGSRTPVDSGPVGHDFTYGIRLRY